MHYVKVDENNGGDAGYDWARAREADQWMRDFLAEPNRAHFNEGFTVSAVGHALDRMHQGAAGIDGTSKKWIDPLRKTLIPLMAALFSYIYLNEITISAWCLAVVVSLEKKGSSANIMDGYRGVHVLNFCSQWYAQCLNDRLGILVTRSTPLEQ